MPSDQPQIQFTVDDLKRLMPWTKMFSSLRMALDLQRLLLATAAVLLIALGDYGLQQMWPQAVLWPEINWPWNFGARFELAVLRPVIRLFEIIRPVFGLFVNFESLIASGLRIVWFFSVWSVFGGAITRSAASQVASDQGVGLPTSLRFSLTRFRSYIDAPMLAVVAVAGLWLFCFTAGGIMQRIPYVGEFAVAAGWFVPLLFGVIMAVVLIGFVCGWPLSVVTISAQGADGFEGFSRSLNYVFSQPVMYAFHWALAIVQGGIVALVLMLVAGFSVHLTNWGVSSGAGPERIQQVVESGPESMQRAGEFFAGRQEFSPDGFGKTPFSSRVAAFWVYVFAALVGSFSISYFWCAATVNYFLMRKLVDGVEYEELYRGIPIQEPEMALAGLAGSTPPATERPIHMLEESENSEKSTSASAISPDPPALDS